MWQRFSVLIQRFNVILIVETFLSLVLLLTLFLLVFLFLKYKKIKIKNIVVVNIIIIILVIIVRPCSVQDSTETAQRLITSHGRMEITLERMTKSNQSTTYRTLNGRVCRPTALSAVSPVLLCCRVRLYSWPQIISEMSVCSRHSNYRKPASNSEQRALTASPYRLVSVLAAGRNQEGPVSYRFVSAFAGVARPSWCLSGDPRQGQLGSLFDDETGVQAAPTPGKYKRNV